MTDSTANARADGTAQRESVNDQDGIVDWDEYGRHVFENIYTKTKLIFEVRAFERGHSLSPHGDEIRIACISAPISIRFDRDEKSTGKFDLRTVRYRDDCHLTQADNKDVPAALQKERLSELSTALTFFPHIVSFGEFGFPPIWREAQPGWDVRSIRDAVGDHKQYEVEVLNKLKQHEADMKEAHGREPTRDFPIPFVHLGSYHCLMTLYNVGVTFPWGSSIAGQDCIISTEPHAGEKKRTHKSERIAAPIFQRKRYPARRIGEHTRTPATRHFDIYKFAFGHIAILICSDVVDLNQFLSVVRYNKSSSAQPPIDFILVPSFNVSPRLPAMCKELSYLANATVILVNARSAPKSGKKIHDADIFCCGRSFAEMADGNEAFDLPPVLDCEEVDVGYQDGRQSKLTVFKLSAKGVESLRHKISGRLAKGKDPGDEFPART